MKLNDPTDIMLNSLPNGKKLMGILRSMSCGETIRIKIDNSFAVKHMVERILNNQWCCIVESSDEGGISVLTIKKVTQNAGDN